MVVNHMAVTKISIKYQIVLDLLHHVFSIFLPYYYILLVCIILKKASTSIHHPHHIIRIPHPPSIVDNIVNCSLYVICLPYLHPPKTIFHIFTWDYGRPLSSILYESTGNCNFFPQINQPFQYTEIRINNYISISFKIDLRYIKD